MPRRRNRFADLERQLRAAGGVAAPGSRLGNFADFKAGKRKIKVTQKLTATERQRVAFAAYPFNFGVPATPTAADRYQVTVTRYSLGLIKNGGVTQNDLGWDTRGTSTTIEPQYYPSLIKAFFPNSATGGALTPTSAITGDEYRRIPGKSCSAPFGRTVTAKDAKDGTTTATLNASEEEDVRKHLTATLKGDANDSTVALSVSYEPEVFRGRTVAITAGVF